MSHSISVKSASGIIVVSDEEVFSTYRDGETKSITRRASAEGFFVIDNEYATEMRIDVVEDGGEMPEIADTYETFGGTFRLKVSSGAIRIWDPADRAKGVRLERPSGTYGLIVRRLNNDDLTTYLGHMKKAVGEEDWKYHERIGRIELTGCGAFTLGILLTIIPFTRSYWWIYVPLLLLPHLLAGLLKRTKRYRRADQARSEFESRQPQLILCLSVDNNLSESVRGGTINLNT